MDELKLTLTVSEAAAKLQVSMPVMYRLCKTPGFPALRIGRKVLIPCDKLSAWLDAQVEVN